MEDKKNILPCEQCNKCDSKRSALDIGKCIYAHCVKDGCCSAFRKSAYWRKKDQIEENAKRLGEAVSNGHVPKYVIGQKVYIIEYPEQIVEAEIVYINITPSGEAQYQIKSYDCISRKITTKQHYLDERYVHATQQDCLMELAEATKRKIIAQLKNLKRQAERNGLVLPNEMFMALPEKI